MLSCKTELLDCTSEDKLCEQVLRCEKSICAERSGRLGTKSTLLKYIALTSDKWNLLIPSGLLNLLRTMPIAQYTSVYAWPWCNPACSGCTSVALHMPFLVQVV